MLPSHFNKKLSRSNTWLYLLYSIIFLHFVVVRVFYIPFSLYILFGIPLSLITLKQFLSNPNKFFTKESKAFLLVFFVYVIYLALIDLSYFRDSTFLYRQAYKSLLIYVVIVGFTNDINQIRDIVKFSLIVLIFSSLLGLLTFMFGGFFTTISSFFIMGISDGELTGLSRTIEGSHSSGLSGHRHYFPYHLCFAIFPCIYFLYHSRKLIKFLWLLSLLIIVVSGISTGVRGLLIAWVFGMLYLVLRYSRRYFSPIKIIAFTIIIIITVSLSFVILPNNTFRRHVEIMKSGTHTSRSGLALVGLQLFADNPIGYGTGGKDWWTKYTTYYRKFVKTGTKHPESLHNALLETIVKGGVVGLLMVILFIFYMVQLARKRLLLSTEDSFFRGTLIASLIAVTVISLVHNNGFFKGEGTSFLCLALLCSRGFKNVDYYKAEYNLESKN